MQPRRRDRPRRDGLMHPNRLVAALRDALPALLDVLVTPDAASSDGRSGLAWVPDLPPLATWDDAERRWRAAR